MPWVYFLVSLRSDLTVLVLSCQFMLKFKWIDSFGKEWDDLPIFVGFAIAFIGSAMAYQLTKGKSKKRKYIIWGINTMLTIAPFFSFAIGLSYALIVQNGWAAMLMWLLFPIIFIIGLGLLLVGIFKRNWTESV